MPPFKLSDCAVFFDFDNTITPFDVLDDIIEKFSVNDNWVSLEKLWKRGRIGSKECLSGQLSGVRITKRELSRYLSRIRLRPYFRTLLRLLKQNGVKPVILSDDFSFIIKTILRANGIKGVKVYSNEIRFGKETLLPSFPHTNRSCWLCGHCKKKHLKKSAIKDKIIIYVGDGLSDICPASHADLVFAKGSLLKHLKNPLTPSLSPRSGERVRVRGKSVRYVAYRGFRDIYNYLKELNDAAKN